MVSEPGCCSCWVLVVGMVASQNLKDRVVTLEDFVGLRAQFHNVHTNWGHISKSMSVGWMKDNLRSWKICRILLIAQRLGLISLKEKFRCWNWPWTVLLYEIEWVLQKFISLNQNRSRVLHNAKEPNRNSTSKLPVSQRMNGWTSLRCIFWVMQNFDGRLGWRMMKL